MAEQHKSQQPGAPALTASGRAALERAGIDPASGRVECWLEGSIFSDTPGGGAFEHGIVTQVLQVFAPGLARVAGKDAVIVSFPTGSGEWSECSAPLVLTDAKWRAGWCHDEQDCGRSPPAKKPWQLTETSQPISTEDMFNTAKEPDSAWELEHPVVSEPVLAPVPAKNPLWNLLDLELPAAGASASEAAATRSSPLFSLEANELEMILVSCTMEPSPAAADCGEEGPSRTDRVAGEGRRFKRVTFAEAPPASAPPSRLQLSSSTPSKPVADQPAAQLWQRLSVELGGQQPAAPVFMQHFSSKEMRHMLGSSKNRSKEIMAKMLTEAIRSGGIPLPPTSATAPTRKRSATSTPTKPAKAAAPSVSTATASAAPGFSTAPVTSNSSDPPSKVRLFRSIPAGALKPAASARKKFFFSPPAVASKPAALTKKKRAAPRAAAAAARPIKKRNVSTKAAASVRQTKSANRSAAATSMATSTASAASASSTAPVAGRCSVSGGLGEIDGAYVCGVTGYTYRTSQTHNSKRHNTAHSGAVALLVSVRCQSLM